MSRQMSAREKMRRGALQVLAATGALNAWHRWRNRNALTVLSLHRVLSEDDPRWPGADPLYTVSTRFFDQLLAWLPRHYAVISLPELQDARARSRDLPQRPLLITFDDGWADNSDHALPLLQKHGLPAVLFCAGEVIGRNESFFQERLIAAWRAGRLQDADLERLWQACGRTPADMPRAVQSEEAVRALIAALQRMGRDAREALLAPLRGRLDDGLRQMVTPGELARLAQCGVALGTHGHQHEPLTGVADLQAELTRCRHEVAVAAGLPEGIVTAISFPFSKQDARVVAASRAAGYTLMFGGGLCLNPLAEGPSDLIARVGITAGPLQDARGDLNPDRLAAYLFRRPIAPLTPG